MAWGLPPKYKASKMLKRFTHAEIIKNTNDTLVDLGYTVTSKGPYNLIAYKKLSMTFMSFFGFCRPKLDVSILANEDSKLTVEITFNYTSGYMSTFNDRGRAKRHVNAIIAKMPI
ncbi:MAG: hypothetical protein P8H56_01200 [Crocinitomicaceae bacterium]|nr:hypothetical protein [Crocinitomicaceae bacterium]MDG1657176.1 hypothetical protein [Crocinitomicaceae bacterium]